MPEQGNRLGRRLKYLNRLLADLNTRKAGKQSKRSSTSLPSSSSSSGKLQSSSQKHLSDPALSSEQLAHIAETVNHVKEEVGKLIVGQENILDMLLCALLANGHVLLEALPGVAKTLLLRTLATVSGCSHSRIQFTVDLLPTDITGITTYDKHTETFKTVQGPIFSHFVLGDEINRAPPKTQSALLEAMQERQVTIGEHTYVLERPFFVMATQNPIESSGTYGLPEAQIDRFLFKLIMSYPNQDEERRVLHKNITIHEFDEFHVAPVLNPALLVQLQQLVHHIHVSDAVEKYIVSLVAATRDPKHAGLKHARFIQYGASPRASISLFIAAKAHALLTGQSYVTPHHVKTVAPHVLRHRILLNYEAQAESVTTDAVIAELLRTVRVP